MRLRMGVCCLGVSFGFCSAAVSAASFTWDATNTTAGVQEGGGYWTANATDTNWWDGSANVAWNNAAGDIAVFGSNTVQTFSTQPRVTNTVDMTLGGIRFNQSYLVGVAGGSLLIFNNGAVITNASTNNVTLANITAPVYTTGTVYRTGNRINWFNTSFNGGGTLIESTVNSDLFNNSNSFSGLSVVIITNSTAQLDLRANGVYAGGGTGPVLRIYGIGGITIQSLGGNGADWRGDIQLLNATNAVMTGSGNNATTPSVFTLSGNISGVGGLALSGQNWGIVLSGSNSYANGTTINAGNVTFANANALPASGLVTISAGSLIATGAMNGVMTWLGSGRIATNGSWGGIAMSASEDVTLGVYSNLFVGAAGVVNFTNTLTPGGTAYRLGGGGGTLIFNQTLAGATSLVVGPTNGVGAVLIANTANSFTGGTTLNAGYTGGAVGNILLLGADNVLGTGRLTLNGGVLASDSAAARTLTNAVTLGGTLQVGQFSAAFGGSNGNITLSGPVNLNGGSRTLNITNAATTLLVSGVITNGSVLTKNGSGTLALTNPGNNYTGGTTLNAGTLVLGTDNVLGSGLLNLVGSVVVASDSAAARTLTNAVTIQAGLQLGNAAGTGPLTFTGILNLGSAAKTLVVNNTITTFSNAITNNAGLIKTGPGTLVLGGANSYAGGTVINNGVLQFNSLGSIGGTGANVTNLATVAFDFADVQSGLARLSTSSSGTVAITTSGAGSIINFNSVGLSNTWLGAMGTVTYDLGNFTPFTAGAYKLGGGSGTLIITNSIVGGASLNIGSSGIVLLIANNSYSGGTVVQGSLALGIDNALPTAGAVTIGNGAASAVLLDLNGYNQCSERRSFNNLNARF